MPTPNPDLIEPRFKDALQRYIEHGIPPGDFLCAVLCNDLREACGRGDAEALDNLPHIVSYLYNRCPAGCWGSEACFEDWQARRAAVEVLADAAAAQGNDHDDASEKMERAHDELDTPDAE